MPAEYVGKQSHQTDRNATPAPWRMLPPRGRIALLVVVSFVLLVDVIIYVTSTSLSWADVLSRLTFTIALALFVWSPFSAVVSLILLSLIEISHSDNVEHLVYLAFSVGLVSYTSPVLFTLLYLGAAGGLVVLTGNITTELTQFAPLALMVIGAISGLVGLAVRKSHNNERDLGSQVDLLQARREVELQEERDRIADELHDIIAHEVTIISMHADVLERVDDEDLRQKSVHAIQTCSRQALKDIRRMLNIIRADESRATSSCSLEGPGIHEVLKDIEREICTLGGKVDSQVEEYLEIPASIDKALEHIAWECGTNIVKHAPNLEQVHISFGRDNGGLLLRMASPLPSPISQTDLPSSGYGIARLQERATVIGGRFTSRALEDQWVAEAWLPKK